MARFSVNEIVNKMYRVQNDTPAYYGYPLSSRKFIIKGGTDVGIVYSYVMDNKLLYWMFYDKKTDSYFYIPNIINNVDVKDLEAQGATSTDDKIAAAKAEAEKEKEGNFIYYAEKWGKPILGVAGLLLLAKIVVPEIAKARSK